MAQKLTQNDLLLMNMDVILGKAPIGSQLVLDEGSFAPAYRRSYNWVDSFIPGAATESVALFSRSGKERNLPLWRSNVLTNGIPNSTLMVIWSTKFIWAPGKANDEAAFGGLNVIESQDVTSALMKLNLKHSINGQEIYKLGSSGSMPSRPYDVALADDLNSVAAFTGWGSRREVDYDFRDGNTWSPIIAQSNTKYEMEVQTDEVFPTITSTLTKGYLFVVHRVTEFGLNVA